MEKDALWGHTHADHLELRSEHQARGLEQAILQERVEYLEKQIGKFDDIMASWEQRHSDHVASQTDSIAKYEEREMAHAADKEGKEQGRPHEKQ